MELIKQDNLMSWFIKNKVFYIHPGNFPTQQLRKYKEIIKDKDF